MKKQGIDVSVITPMFNEAKIIAASVQKFINYLDSLKLTYELILVDDGSTDDSYIKAKALEETHPGLRVVTYKKNRGRGYALRTGIKNSSGNYVFTIESDLNYGVKIISQLYNELQNDFDIVIASPYMPGGKVKNVPFSRALLSKFGNKVLRLAVSSKIYTVTGMTRGYKGDFIRCLYLEEDGKEIHLEIVSKAEVMGADILEIPATLAWPDKNKKKTGRKSSFKIWKLIKSHLKFATNESPFLLFGSVGGIMLLAGLIFLINLSWDYFIKGEVIGDRIVNILTTVFLFFSGTLVLLVSFLAYQMKDIKKEITKLKQMLSEK